MRPGLVMGHEFAGEVVAIGADVDGWREGMHACALPLIGCGRCVACATGDVAHCPTVDMLGAGGSSGGYAQHDRLSARESCALPEGIGADVGAPVEPPEVAIHAVDRAGLGPHDRVVVAGPAPVRLAVTVWARHAGARELVVTAPVAHRRVAAVDFGATDALEP